MSGVQAWEDSMYGLLEPQSLHNAKDRRGECQQYIETWVKESQREVLGKSDHEGVLQRDGDDTSEGKH